MSRPTHPIPAEWLSAYHDGELDAPRRAQVDAHLPGCADCQRTLAELSALSQTLAADPLPPLPAAPADFWRGVRAQLPARPEGPAANPRAVLLRWAPGLGLLLLIGLAQVAAAAGTALLVFSAPVARSPAWAGWVSGLAADATLGWLAWLLPAGWSGLGVFLFWLAVSAALAVLYLGWLGYEWRYGLAAGGGRAEAH